MVQMSQNPAATKRRVLLVQPNYNPYQEYIPFLATLEPIALEILATTIGDLAEVEIFDRRIEGEAAYIKSLKRLRPDLVGVTTHGAGETLTSRRVLELAREHAPDATTIVGGVHPTLSPGDYHHPAIDLVCIGNGEETLREVLLAGRKTAALREVRGLAINSHLDPSADGQQITPARTAGGRQLHMPSPTRHLVARYRRRYWQGIVLSSRGCPYRCSFCALWKVAGGKYMTRPAEEVVEEIAATPQKYVLLADDNTFHDIERAERLVGLIEQRGLKKKYTCYARTDTIVKHPELFRRWKRAGLDWLVIGFESTSQDRLSLLNKSNSMDNNRRAITFLQEIGITNLAHFIVDPDFEEQDFREMYEFIDQTGITVPFFVPLTPIPGTELHAQAQAEGRIDNSCLDYYNFEYMVLKTRLPKTEFYRHFLDLWRKSVSPRRFLRLGRRRDLPLALCFLRWLICRRTMKKLAAHYQHQLQREEHARAVRPPAIVRSPMRSGSAEPHQRGWQPPREPFNTLNHHDLQ